MQTKTDLKVVEINLLETKNVRWTNGNNCKLLTQNNIVKGPRFLSMKEFQDIAERIKLLNEVVA